MSEGFAHNSALFGLAIHHDPCNHKDEKSKQYTIQPTSQLGFAPGTRLQLKRRKHGLARRYVFGTLLDGKS